MSRRHEPPRTVRPERTLTRSGLWATGPVQLQLPFEASGLSERITASGRLKLTPDYDVFAWLCERWQVRPTDSGWMRPTLYEVGASLYRQAPTGENYRDLRSALDRLAWVTVTIDGYDIESGEFRDNWLSRSHLLELGRPTSEDPTGLQRPSIRLGEWLRKALEEQRVVRVPWRTMRLFHERQQLAKRLWVYLACERWKRVGDGSAEGTWIACGDRLFAALGMNYAQPRQARAALKRACETIRHKDARFAAGQLNVVKVGSSWRIQAKRPAWECWRELKAEHEEARRVIAASLGKAA